MYNRYIRNDNGVYSRMPQPDMPASSPAAMHEAKEHQEMHRSIPAIKEQKSSRPVELRFVSSILEKLHLSDIDAGDLLLLLLLFVLFHENGDEELLIAIGLLLIL